MTWLTRRGYRVSSGVFVSTATSCNATCTLDGSADSLASGSYVDYGFECKGFSKVHIGLECGNVGTAFDVKVEVALDEDAGTWYHKSTVVDMDDNTDTFVLSDPASFVRIRCNSTENVAFTAEYMGIRRA